MRFFTSAIGLLTLITPVIGVGTSSYGASNQSLPTPGSNPNFSSPSLNIPAAPDLEVDVIVVGGGFSGVMAAYNVSQAGHKTLLLEARHRIGGRSQSQALQSAPGSIVEMGATWINRKTQPATYAICEHFGLETMEQYTTGDVIRQDHNGTVHRESQDQPGGSEQVNKFNEIVAVAAAGIDIRDFDAFPEDEDVTLAEWVAQKGLWEYPEVRAACERLCSAIVGRMPQEVGVHYFLDYLQSGGGLESLVTEGEMGAQSLKVKNGTSAITDTLANAMPEGSVMLNSPVQRIIQRGNGEVDVITNSGRWYKSKKVILAIPTNTYSHIHFTPPLPSAKRALVTRTMPGIYAKVILSYTAPWWRDAGLVGKFSSPVGPICFSWDTSDVEAKQYSLALFISGNIAAAWHELSALGREEAIIEHLVTLVGPELAAEARNVSEVNTVEWTKESYLWGAPTSSMGPGMLREYGVVLRDSFGDLHFGGGETAYEWKGYLEGAITSGKRAAKEVVDSLGSGTGQKL